MKKGKFIVASILTAFAAVPVLSGCKKKGDEPVAPVSNKIDFSIAVRSGRNQFEVGKEESLILLGEGINEEGRTFVYNSSDPTVATVDENGVITPLKAGSVSFQAIETTSNSKAELTSSVDVVPAASSASGGFNYSAANDIAQRIEILGKLEKYVMDAHLTGITLFDNGGYIKYNKPRVHLGTEHYITGYGFGLLREGYLEGGSIQEETPEYRNFYHTSFSQDPLTINAMNDSGSQVSDLYSYISSAYFATKMAANKTEYEWYPLLAKNKAFKPEFDAEGVQTGWTDEQDQKRPVPMEAPNDLGLYAKWRIYVKTCADGVKYRYDGSNSVVKTAFDNRNVDVSDYEFIYKFLLTGKNGMSRGAEMAADTSYGIKGALKFYNDTISENSQENIDKKWNDMKASGELGINSGTDEKGQTYIDLELINPIDEFTAMYTLSSNLTSPLPRAFFEAIGDGSIITAAARYGNFNNGDNNAILDYVLSLGAYRLTHWDKKQLVVFSRNDEWFERKADSSIYRIEGIHQRLIDTSQDPELTYSEFINSHNLDVCGIPTSKIKVEKNNDDVYETKGDSTFKLNVNSCTQEQWTKLFGPDGKINKNSNWNVKSWMSNSNFLDGLFSSINRKQFAEKRGVQPSINYFSDAYLSDPEKGKSYNETDEHKEAVKNYHSIGADGQDNFGFDYGRAVKSFRAAVNELSMSDPNFVKGTKTNPLQIEISICWMYPTDVQEYGDDIANYIESAFNDDAVCGGTVRLHVKNEWVDDWQQVYNERMMKGQFDLAFGAISGNTYNPLNFLEVLKTDNSSTFTLNWGEDTALLSDKNPIYYNGMKWSFDALWSCADHGGISRNGEKVEPVQKCYKSTFKRHTGTGAMPDELYTTGTGGFDIDIPLQFEETDHVTYSVNKIVINALGIGNVAVDSYEYDEANHKIRVFVSESTAKTITEGIRDNVFRDEDRTKPDNQWMNNPFLQSKYNNLWSFGLYYTLTIEGARPAENYFTVKANSKAQ